MMGTSVLVPTWDRDPVRTSPRGRVCACDGCATRLSVYNPSPFCALHNGGEDAPAPAGYCRCRECGRVLPWTAEFFHRDGRKGSTPLHRACKDCRNHHNRTEKVRAPLPESKRCPHCGKTKKLTAQFWYGSPTATTGFASWCKVCASAAARDRWRAKAEVS
jgi:hypothetical protein